MYFAGNYERTISLLLLSYILLPVTIDNLRGQDLSERARIAAEPYFLGRPGGAGNDPQTAVGQPEFSARPSAFLNTSIETFINPYSNIGVIRDFFRNKGLTYNLTYTNEIFGNKSGGSTRGSIYQGRFDLQFEADLEKLFGYTGLIFHSNIYQIHGKGLSQYFIDNLMTVSSIESLPSFRLSELWFEQKFLDNTIGIRMGQLAADTEFAISQTSSFFLNSTFGWPNIMSSNIPNGGPVYPFAVPAARIKFVPNRNFSLQVGIFNGDPVGVANSDQNPEPQRRNRTGTNFRTKDPAFVIAEAAYAYNIDKDSAGEPGTVTFGGWHHFGQFDSLHKDIVGRALAAQPSTGIARRFRGNSGLYGILDQTVYRESEDPNDGASAFIRISGSPSDRNMIDFYLDTGIVYKGLFSSRSDDTIGVGVAMERIARSDFGVDVNSSMFNKIKANRRTSEIIMELSYQAVIGSGITIQPDFQYIFRPGGGYTRKSDISGARVRNAAVFGLRASIRY